MKCKALQCRREAQPDSDFCPDCVVNGPWNGYLTVQIPTPKPPVAEQVPPLKDKEVALPLSVQYPRYYKSVGKLTELDVYAVHQLFAIQDPSGAVQHASKKLLLSGVRTGGKSAHDDIREARDTLNRWLELNLA